MYEKSLITEPPAAHECVCERERAFEGKKAFFKREGMELLLCGRVFAVVVEALQFRHRLRERVWSTT